MLPGKISKRVVSDRLAWVDRMLNEIRALPFGIRKPYLCRIPEIFGRLNPVCAVLWKHFSTWGGTSAAKGFGEAVTEYKEIAATLKRRDVISAGELILMQKLAGYRNRLVHFYHEVSADELYEISSSHLGDVETIANSLRVWLADHSDLLDETL